MGNGRWAIGNRQWAMGNGQWATGDSFGKGSCDRRLTVGSPSGKTGKELGAPINHYCPLKNSKHTKGYSALNRKAQHASAYCAFVVLRGIEPRFTA